MRFVLFFSFDRYLTEFFNLRFLIIKLSSSKFLILYRYQIQNGVLWNIMDFLEFKYQWIQDDKNIYIYKIFSKKKCTYFVNKIINCVNMIILMKKSRFFTYIFIYFWMSLLSVLVLQQITYYVVYIWIWPQKKVFYFFFLR